jgi:hypothetical protein
MSKLIVLASVLAVLTAMWATLAFFKLPSPAVAHHAVAQPIDPAILHAQRQQWRDDMPLP